MCVQARANDPQVAFHAIHVLSRIAGAVASLRWSQLGFGRTSSTSLEGQQRTIGRDKLACAPLGSRREYDPVELSATAANGGPLIPTNAHIRLANPESNDGQRILRRGYSYSEPAEPGSGQIDAGLFFIAFQRNPERQFIPLQRRLAVSDALNHHTVHTSSSIFACPPGAAPGEFIGHELFVA